MTTHKVPGSHYELTTVNILNAFNMKNLWGWKIKLYQIDEASILE